MQTGSTGGGREKRAYARLPLRLGVQLSGPAWGERVGEIRDFCPGGIFIVCDISDADPRNVPSADYDAPITLDFSVDVAGEQITTMLALVVRVFDAGLGLAFVDPDPALLEALELTARAQQASDSIRTGGDITLDRGARERILVEISKRATHEMDTVFGTFFKKATEGLMLAARETASSVFQQQYFDAINIFDTRTKDVEEHVRTLVETHFTHLGEPLAAAEIPAESTALSLVDKHEFEYLLVVSELSAKLESWNADVLREMNLRLSQICDVRVHNENNPIGPLAVCHIFRTVILELALEPESSDVVYDAFGGHVVHTLDEFYCHLDDFLAEQGLKADAGLAPERGNARDSQSGRPWAKKQTPASPNGPPEATSGDVAQGHADLGPEGVQGPEQVWGGAANESIAPSSWAAPSSAEPASGSEYVAGPAGSVAPFPLTNMVIPGSEAFAGESAGALAHEQAGGHSAFGHTPQDQGVGGQNLSLGELGPGGSGIDRPGIGVVSGVAGSSAVAVPWGAAANPLTGFVPGPVGGQVASTGAPAAGQVISTAPGVQRVRRAQPVLRSQAAAPHQIGAPAAFGAAQALFDIRRAQVSKASDPSFATFEPASSGTGGHFSHDEVLAALAGLGAMGGQADVGVPKAPLRERLLAVLESQPEGANKNLEDETLDVVDLIEQLFEAFDGDDFVAPHIKPRLAPLQPVIQRVALLDQRFLNAAEHPARRVINALGSVRAHGNAQAPEWELPLDSVVEMLTTATDAELATVFVTADDVVTRVLQEQRGHYDMNVAKVVKIADDQQTFLRAPRHAEAHHGRSEPGQGVTQEWGIWLGRVKRLRLGNQVELIEGQKRHRVTLAWVGENFNPFVFVDDLGTEEASLSLPELAMHLRRGLAVVIERPVLPLVDRAMYAVLHQVHERIETRATQDSLTGFDNRRSLEMALARAIKESAQDREIDFTLAYIAFEGLADVEQRGGERAVFSVTRKAAERASETLGNLLAGATLARVDKAAFAFLVRNDDAVDVERLVMQVKGAVEDAPYQFEEHRFTVRTRIGAVLVGHFSENESEAIEQARATCEEAGHEQPAVTIRTKHLLGTDVRPMMDWVTLINKTLGEDRIQLRCQLVKPLGTDGKPMYEVLLGLTDDDDQAIAATDFINALEHYDQMAALDRWVIRNALMWMSENRKTVRGAAGFSIKLTGRSLAEDNLMEYVLGQLTASSVPPGKICLEMTYVDAQANLEQAGRLVRTLREFGCRFALSKFGGLPTSRDVLDILPVDFLKIDGRFVRGLMDNDDDLAVVHSATQLAHASGLRTVAEFVETPEVIEKLEALGVDMVQGMAVQAPRYLVELGVQCAPAPPAALEQTQDVVATAAAERTVEVAPVLPPPGADKGWEDELAAFMELDAESTRDFSQTSEKGTAPT